MAKKQTKKAPQEPATSGTKKNSADPQKVMDAKQKLSVNFKLGCLLALISIVLYANTLKNGFVLDDGAVIINNSYVTKGISAVPDLLTTPHFRGIMVMSNDTYRPLSLVLLATEYQFFETNPMPYHLVNVILFAVCVLLLFFFLDKLFERKQKAAAFIASLLFALHPIHTEAVANIKSNDELLCFFFAFLGLNVFIKYIEKGKAIQLISGAICFFLSLLSKETVITFLGVLPLIFFFYRNENKKRSMHIMMGTGVMTVVFLSIRYFVLSYYHANEFAKIGILDNSLVSAVSFGSRIATAVLILGYYLKLLFIPYPLVCDYGYNTIPNVTFGEPQALIALLAYLFLVVFSIRLFLKSPKNPFAFGILFFLITISLIANVFFLIGSTMGERLLFFPSVGFCVVVAFLLEKVGKAAAGPELGLLKQPRVLVILIPICIIYSIILINRNSNWLDNYTLFRTDVERSPNDSKLNYNLAIAVEKSISENETDHGKQDQVRKEAIQFLKKAVAIYPDYYDAHVELGSLYVFVSQPDSAEFHSKRALEIKPGNKDAINHLAIVYMAREKYHQAINLFREEIRFNSDIARTYSSIGRCYIQTAQYDSAEYYLNKSIESDPGFMDAINNLAGVYFTQGKYPKAIELYKDAIKLNPKFLMAYSNLGVCYQRLGLYDSTIYVLKKALLIDPNLKAAYENIAFDFKHLGITDSAAKYEGIARKSNPTFKL